MSLLDNPLRVTVGALQPVTLTNVDVIACFLGDTITHVFDTNLGVVSCSILRQPTGGTASFAAGVVTPNVVGYHEFTAAYNASSPAQNKVRVVVFPVALKGAGGTPEYRVCQPNRTTNWTGVVADPNPRGAAACANVLTAFVREQARLGVDLTAFDAGASMTPSLNGFLATDKAGANYVASPFS